jgi:two-component system cell cycle response regulator CpdR
MVRTFGAVGIYPDSEQVLDPPLIPSIVHMGAPKANIGFGSLWVHPIFTRHKAYGMAARPHRLAGCVWGRKRAMAKILLAEDDTDMRRFLVKALQNAGFDVTSYDNGLSAYQRLREEPYALLLTDIVMPEMDGIELARRAAELDPDIKIMFITGFAAVALNADSTAPKHAKVLSKPIHLRDLVNEVNKMLAA